jgi:AcrR family transcriptional regulator
MSLREQKKRQVRLDILAAAGELIDQHGYENARMREVATAANVSYQTLYNYFPTKALILQALLTQDVEHIASAVDQLIDGYDGKLLETLNAINRTRLDVVSHRDRDLWRVVSIELFRNQRDAGHIYQLIDAAAHEKLQLLLNLARQSGDLDANIDTRLLADTLFALSQHAFSHYMMEPSISKTMLLQTLQDQTTLLVKPYLPTS